LIEVERKFAILCFKQEEILEETQMGPEFLEKLCLYYYNWQDLIDVMFSPGLFAQVEKLQIDSRAKVDQMVEETQLEELSRRCSFTQEELKYFYKKFSEVSKTGSLNVEAFEKILPKDLKAFSENETVLNALFKQFDKNEFGTITFREFGIGLNLIIHGGAEEKQNLIFKIFDRDMDGFISREELRFMLEWQYKSMGFVESSTMVQSSVEMAFSMFDKDKDDKLSLEEFKPFLKKQPIFFNLMGNL